MRSTAPPPDRPLFHHLLASQPMRERRGPSTAVAVALHGALVLAALWGTSAVGDEEPDQTAPVIHITIPKSEPLPELPSHADAPTIEQPAIASQELPRGFQTLPPVDIVPPTIEPPGNLRPLDPRDYEGEGIEGGRGEGRKVKADSLSGTGRFTPFTVAPVLRNREEVARALRANYPAVLAQAGVGGTAILWFLIDEEGRVLDAEVKESSGQPMLDRAALDVARIMRFSPALNRDRKVRVWVQLPVEFSTR